MNDCTQRESSREVSSLNTFLLAVLVMIVVVMTGVVIIHSSSGSS